MSDATYRKPYRYEDNYKRIPHIPSAAPPGLEENSTLWYSKRRCNAESHGLERLRTRPRISKYKKIGNAKRVEAERRFNTLDFRDRYRRRRIIITLVRNSDRHANGTVVSEPDVENRYAISFDFHQTTQTAAIDTQKKHVITQGVFRQCRLSDYVEVCASSYKSTEAS